MNRIVAGIAFAAAALIATAGPASAHAVLDASEPASGARVETIDEIELHLSERPDRDLSRIELLDIDGDAVTLGPLEIGDTPEDLRASIIDELSPGTYLVTWRAFSAVDGHVTVGAFPFGFQVDPEAIAVPEGNQPGATPLSIIGRALFLLGLALALGSGVIELLSPLAVHALPRLALGGIGATLIGIAIMGHQQRVDSGASIAAFLGTPIGSAIIWRATGVLVAGALAYLWRRSMRRRRMFVPAMLIALAAVAVVHVLNGHASVGGGLQVGLQTVHLLALGAWIGGFVPLLAAIRRGNGRRVVTRFSTMALVLVPVVIVTGQVRAFDELPSIESFWTSTYGRVLILKWLVLLGILTFAARNRRTHVARIVEDPQPLQRAVRSEAILGAAIFGLAALLANLAPRAVAEASAIDDGPIRVTRTSFAGDLEATLIAAPGTPGPTTLTLELVTLPDRAPVEEVHAQLRLRYRGRPGVEPAEVELTEDGPGRFSGSAVLTPAGPYEATLLVQRAEGSTEVILPLATRTDQQLSEVGTNPVVTSITFEDASSVQLYLDPEVAGAGEFHATYFEADGTERPVEDVVVVASGPEGVRPLVVRTLTPGHVVADTFLGAGSWRFDVSARTADGDLLSAWVIRQVS